MANEKKLDNEIINYEMEQYRTLINDSLFEESYMLLEENVSRIGDTISKNKHMRDFFGAIFENKFFNAIVNKNNIYPNLLPLSIATVNSLQNDEFLKPMAPKFGNFVNVDKIMVMFAFLLQANEFDKAKFLFNYFKPNAEIFVATSNKIIDNNNTEALRFICENMDNIHYSQGALLRKSAKASHKILRMLINEFDFDVNEQDPETGYNLIHLLVADKNVKNFKFIAENSSGVINWNATTYKQGRNPGLTFFDIVEQTGMQVEFFSPLLEDMTLKTNDILKIHNSLFNSTTIDKYSDTEIYGKLFSHPNFDPQIMNLGQGYFLYGILSELGQIANRSGDDAAKPYLNILDAYVEYYPEDNVPEATNFNIVGAAVHVASKSKSKVVGDAVSLILRRYNKYINKPNPFGTLPILQVEKDSPIYRILLNNGAISPEPEPGFWRSIAGAFSKKKQMEIEEEQEMETRAPVVSNNNLTSVKNKMREDFRVMRTYISNPICDATIKMRCENMFLKSERLIGVMDRHNITQAYEDVHFLGENFASYLKNSLSSYIDLCKATVDLGNEVDKNAKLKNAKLICIEQIELLAEQVQLISTNISNEIEGDAARNLNINGRFLENRFKRPVDLGFENILSREDNEEEENVNQDRKEEVKRNTVKIR